MHIRDALIDASTGGLILEGSMQVALANSPLPLMPAHNQLLLTKIVGLTFSCVMQMERLSNSLCKTISLSTRLCLSVLDFDQLDDAAAACHGNVAVNRTFSGMRCRTFKHETDSFNVFVLDLQVSLLAQGLGLLIKGGLARDELVSANEEGLPTDAGSFLVQAKVTWATLRLRDFRVAAGMHRFVPKATRIPPETHASSFDGWTNLCRGSMTIVETDGSISKPAQHALTVDLTNHKLFVRNGDTPLMTSDGFLQLDYKGVSFVSKLINGVVVAYLLQWNADGTPYRRYGELSFVTTGAEVVGAVVHPSGLAPEEVGDPSVSMLQRIQALNCVVEMISEACLWWDQGAKPLP